MVDPTGRAAVSSGRTAVRELAADVYWLGLGGRTQTSVYLVRSGESWSLVDAGWAADAQAIRSAARHVAGATVRPTSILLTHAHPDHSGAARELARDWRCPIYVHPQDLPIATGDFAAMCRTAGPLDRWLVLPMLRVIGRRRRDAILARSSLVGFVEPLGREDDVPGMPGWTWLLTSGHSPGHVSYFRAEDRVLLTGDAVVNLRVNSLAGAIRGREGLSGPPWYTTWDPARTAASIAALARLEPRVIGSGHGPALVGPDVSARLHELASRVGRADAKASRSAGA